MRYFGVWAYLLCGLTLTAQTPDDQRPTFLIASIVPNRSDGPPGGIRPIATGQLTAINVTLRALILRAYALHDSQLRGGPDWLASERFDVIAKTDRPPTGGTRETLVMLRRLLSERFGLRTHADTRELPSYALRLNRADRQLGPQMRASTIDCAANPTPAAPNTAPVNAEGWPPCGLVLMRTLAAGGRSRTEARHSSVTMPELATQLQQVVDRPVVDRTALTGVFDLEYAFLREDISAAPDNPVRADVPDLFTAFREQLGLRLESQTTPTEVIVIDEVERPTAN